VFIGNDIRPVALELNNAFDNGLEDFIPISLQNKEYSPHSSMFKTLSFYFTTYGNLLSNPSDPFCAALFPIKLVGTRYGRNCALLDLQVKTMSGRDWAVARHTTAAEDEADTLEADWLMFRSVPIRQELEDIFEALAIPNIPPDPERMESPDWQDWKTDLQFLNLKLKSAASFYNDLTGQISARYGLIAQRQLREEAQRSSREANMMTKLTTLVTVFAPATLATGVLSMNGPFTPGARLFWVFFILLAFSFGATGLFLISTWTSLERRDLMAALGYYRFKSAKLYTRWRNHQRPITITHAEGQS
jgi:hypothetical protein